MAEIKENNPVEQKLQNLYDLQQIDSKIDKIRILRGELPLQIEDLEEKVNGLNTRSERIKGVITKLNVDVATKKNEIKEAEALLLKYDTQQQSVRNNREFDSINKEIEFKNLEIELSKKRIREYLVKLSEQKEIIIKVDENQKECKEDLDRKKEELDQIIAETRKDEDELMGRSKAIEKEIDEKLLISYRRIRGNMKNKMAVVAVDRHSCGGCFNKIPPQRQLDIATRKKLIVCEYCGRILVDGFMGQE